MAGSGTRERQDKIGLGIHGYPAEYPSTSMLYGGMAGRYILNIRLQSGMSKVGEWMRLKMQDSMRC